MKVIFLGTGSGMPTLRRNVSSVAIILEDRNKFWLWDCGEATQHQIQKAGLKLSKLEKIFITHLHGDHVFGLPGLLATRGMQDIKTKEVLMLAYSNKESLKIAFEKGLATYYSRSRQTLWTKGETSGNTQNLIRVKYDCDRDTLLFLVEQNGPACHTGEDTCFGSSEFNFSELYDVLVDRLVKLPEDSYTTKLFKDEMLLKRKI